MRAHRFQHPDELISDRKFWICLIVYAVLFVGAVSAFADGSNHGNLDYSGTLAFGQFAQPEISASNRVNFAQYRGAVTLASKWSGTATAGNRITSNSFRS